MIRLICILFALLFVSGLKAQKKAEIPVPTKVQQAWQEAELGVLIQYDLHTFTPGEWWPSRGDAPIEDINVFNPEKLDTDQWVRAARDMGAEFAVFSVSHVSGFRMWQSDVNPYSLKSVKWGNGKRDILQEFIESCKKYDIKPGIYIGTRQNAHLNVYHFKATEKSTVTQEEYNKLIEAEVEELCTRYGDFFEFWFDGGAYGVKEGGPDILGIFEKNQPNCLFYHSFDRADARWGGSESGTVPYPCWATMPFDGYTRYKDKCYADNFHLIKHGDPDGKFWCPAMSDAPILSNGGHLWFWEKGSDTLVSPVDDLVEKYYKSVGRNSTLIIGLAPDDQGLIPEPVMERCKEFGNALREIFSNPIARTSGKGNSVKLRLPANSKFNTVVIQEDIKYGERIRQFKVEYLNEGQWKVLTTGTCIGHKRIVKFDSVTASKLRLVVIESIARPIFKSFEVYDSDLDNSAEIFVSPSGSDNNPGSKVSPFATAERARDEAREMRKQNKKPVTVFFREGVYHFSNPLLLKSDDSGVKDKPLLFSAYENEKVVFSGSQQIYPEWKKHSSNILVAPVKMTIDQGFSPRILYVNGEAYPLARYPNLIKGKRPFSGVSPDCISPERTANWKSPIGAYVHGMQHGKWGSIHYRIIGITEDGFPHLELVSINTSTMYNNAQLHKTDRYVENVFEELDAPGEWFWDKASGLLYFYPPENIDVHKATIEIPTISCLVKFEGDLENPVKHIKFSNISFEKTRSTWYLTTEHLPVGDYVIHRGATVLMEGTEDCEIADCDFNQIGSNGVMLSNYNKNTSIVGNSFMNVQANGIVLVGSRDAMRDSPWCNVLDSSATVDLSSSWGYKLTYKVWEEPLRDRHPSTDTVPGPKTDNYPRFCLVEDNLVTRAGELEKQVAGVLLSMCAENTINHNSIYDLPRAGICINDGCWGGIIVENNDVFHTVLSTADHGPFNSWGRDRHWTMAMHGVVKQGDENAHDRSMLDTYKTNIIRHNRFTHTISSHSWGIDLDDGSSNYHIYDNLTIGNSVKLREGFFRTVENNIFIGKFPPGKHVCFDNTEDVLRRNIFVNTSGETVFEAIHAKPSQVKEIDSNLYYIASGEPAIVFLKGQVEDGYSSKMTIPEWQQKGHDVNSVVSDPLFVNLELGNYKLNKNSPAFKLGFKEFALDNFGVSKPAFVEEAKAAYKKFAPTLKLNRETVSENKHYKWMGASIKSMSTEGEKSVAGIDDIKGVILVNVPEGSMLFNQGARSGDVILKANGKDIKTIEDLKKELNNTGNSIRTWVDGNPPAHDLIIKNPQEITE